MERSRDKTAREKRARKSLAVAISERKERKGKVSGGNGKGEVGKWGVWIEVGEGHLNREILECLFYFFNY